ncbi:primary-amine oxidase [Streptomyces sp. NPDC029554]|uniref:primary-amine oxidase n=1 Tax=Streptomyces sp. NPDC029554 TaxID=3155126 RepID=UPI0034060B2E
MHSPLFDALTADEISTVSDIVRATGIGGVRPGFAAVFTEEPDKALLRAGETVSRKARAIVLDRTSAATYDVLVDLNSESVISSVQLTDGGAPMLAEELDIITELTKADPRYVEALAKRGITDLSLVQLDPFGAGNQGDIDLQGRRLWNCVSYYRHFPEDNGYAHVIEGVIATVDTVKREVYAIHDYGVKPINMTCNNYAAEHNQPMRNDIKPLEITQPDGVSFKLDGPLMEWQKWRFRINMHPLEGLVLTGVEYKDQDEYRSVMHRGSLSEMIVPYGDPNEAHYWRSAFDAGEYGLGKLANSLLLGCDCLGEIVYLDAVMADDDGNPTVIKNAICIHEEDAGILWKHTDWVTGNVDVRRSRKLVVSFISTIGNYHYGFYWNFFQDGHIEVDTKLLGIVQTRAIEPGEVPEHATPIAENLAATYHQHLFSFRLDMEVDGWQNTVYQNDVSATPVGPKNPNGNAISVTKTLIAREQDGDGFTNPQTARSWTVVNPNKRNRAGLPVGYKLLPGWASDTLIAQHPSLMAKRAGFATKNIWVTPYAPNELRSAGEHPNASRRGAGLPEWTTQNRPVDNTDVVLWHTVGVTHIPRSEDWPVMPTEVASFMLIPNNFFDQNPALDVPASEPKHNAGTTECCH